MKKFTKLALVSSMAISANAMAMQAMDDSALSATTGQDGLTIGIGISKVTIDKLFIHDNDGYSGTYKNASGELVTPTEGQAGWGGTGAAGAIVIQAGADEEITLTNGQKINRNAQGLYIGANYSDSGAHLLSTKNLADLKIDSDAGATGGAFLNIAAAVSGLEIHVGEVGVTASGTQGAAINSDGVASASAIRRGAANISEIKNNGVATGKFEDTSYNAILSGLTIITGKMDANIQVGSAPQGAMIKLKTSMIGGLEIKDLGILDNSTANVTVGTTNGLRTGGLDVKTKEAGQIYIDSIKIADANGADLTIDADVQVFNNAYYNHPTTGEHLGKAAHLRIVSNNTTGTDQYISGIHLGNSKAGSIGDVEVQGLRTYYSPFAGEYKQGAVITISGH